MSDANKYLNDLPTDPAQFTPDNVALLRKRFKEAKAAGEPVDVLKAIGTLGAAADKVLAAAAAAVAKQAKVDAAAAAKANKAAAKANPKKADKAPKAKPAAAPEAPVEPPTAKELAALAKEANAVLVIDPPISMKDDGALDRLVKELRDLRKKDIASDDPQKLVFTDKAVATMRKLNVKIPGEGKPAKVRTPGEGKARKPGVIAAIQELITAKALTKVEIVEALAKRFPDRPVDGMRRTVNIQLPGRMSKEKGITIKVAEGKYKVA